MSNSCGPFRASENRPPSVAENRSFDCSHYETCLGIAAALDWKSFSCAACKGKVNQQLLWRSHQRLKADSSLSRVCQLPTISLVELQQESSEEASIPKRKSA